MLIDRPILLKSTLTYTINEHARIPTLYQAQPEVNFEWSDEDASEASIRVAFPSEARKSGA